MPIGQGDIAPVQNLVNALFQPGVRDYWSRLIPLANAASANNLLVAPGGVGPYLAPGAVAGGGAPPATAAAPPPQPPDAAVQDRVWLLNAAEQFAMFNQWWGIWNRGGGAPPAGAEPSDVALLDFLRDYILNPAPAGGPAGAPYVLWIPRTTYDGMVGDQVRLRLREYVAVPLWNAVAGAWAQAAVERFFTLLAAGAHMVVVHAPTDVAGLGLAVAPESFYDRFGLVLGPTSNAALFHSHYRGGWSLTNLYAAYAYPNTIVADAAPNPCPYIAAMLVGSTAYRVGGNYNTFFQLEGWPAFGTGGWHGADYNVHNATKWNLSTFGASIYSEKRGTTVFLAPANWNPQPQPGTLMAPYVGAGTPQGWLETALIRI